MQPTPPDPWLSVIMPTRNGERWIAEALGSICADGDAEGIECILLDDSDGPGTLRIAERFADRLQLRALANVGPRSWQAATSRGIGLARAPHACVLHVDDVWLPGRAAALRRWIAEDPDAALHLSPGFIIGADGRRLGMWRCPLAEGPVPREMLLARLLVQNFIVMPAPVFRRDVALATGGLDAALWYTADWDLWLRLGAAGRVRYHATPLTGFRVHGNSLTVIGSRSLSDFEAQQRIVLDRHIGLLPAAERDGVLRLAEASIAVNTALAGALNGAPGALPRAAWQVLRLGPRGIAAFLRDTRLMERVLPRLRAKLAGGW
jgi:glycosyltransferase involved in cell wall biosynthesis